MSLQVPQPQSDEHVFLIGRPPIEEYLSFLVVSANGQNLDRRALMDEWRSANDHLKVLEQQEAGWPDHPQIGDIPPHLHSFRAQVLADPMFQRAFDLLPTSIGMVELDRLVVYQKNINLNHVRRIQERLGAAPSEEEIFCLCLPIDHEPPEVNGAWVAGNSYVFQSPSNDLRFHEPKLLNAAQIAGYLPMGLVAGVLGLVVGFGANYLQAMYAENRLILGNGSNRAYALRDMGIKHVPCVIQHVSRREELSLTGALDVQQHPDLYLVAPRPPLLKDYFDQQLRKLVAVPRKLRQVKLTIGIEMTDVPDM
jgi:hypothetical protein